MTKSTKAKQLHDLITSKDLSFLMEAHSGLSAKIVEEAGFQGIWGSGLSISASLGVRDNNEASWTQVLDVCEYMSDAVSIPMLLDGDTGYGNFNNMRRLVKKLEQRDVAGVCIEDKIFPKTNSFLRGEAQPLADIDEFCGKIKAGLDARSDDNFCVVARVEAFIAGHGLKEALKRAEAYRKAGATAILMHSKIATPDEIFAFMKEWGDRAPVVIVPTKYYATPTEEFRNQGISTVIWANHLVRTSIKAMQETAKTIYQKESLIDVEDKVASVKEIFRLQNDDELVEAEKKYFSGPEESTAIILAASRGKELGPLTEDRPKALLNVNGEPLLKQMVDKLVDHAGYQAHVIRGYMKESFPTLNCSYIDNDEFETTGELYSLSKARNLIKGRTLISYGDIAYRSFILDMLAHSDKDITIVVDSDLARRGAEYVGDFVNCSSANKASFSDNEATLVKTALTTKESFATEAHGEWIGLVQLSSNGAALFQEVLGKLESRSDFKSLKMGDLFTEIIASGGKINVEYIKGHWMDIDNFNDFENIQVF